MSECAVEIPDLMCNILLFAMPYLILRLVSYRRIFYSTMSYRIMFYRTMFYRRKYYRMRFYRMRFYRRKYYRIRFYRMRIHMLIGAYVTEADIAAPAVGTPKTSKYGTTETVSASPLRHAIVKVAFVSLSTAVPFTCHW